MVSSSKRFPTPDTQGQQEDSSRPIFNQFKSQSENLCFSLSRPKGNSSGHNDGRLGEVGTPLSVSSNQFDFEGFEQVTTNKVHNSSSIHTRDTNTTMVHGSQTTEDTIQDDTSSTSTSGVVQIDEGSKAFQTSRLEVIKTAYSKRFPGCDAAVTLMAAPLRPNSIKDYQHKWTSFLSFLEKCE